MLFVAQELLEGASAMTRLFFLVSISHRNSLNCTMFLYQKTRRFFAQITGGLEQMGSEEIDQLGGKRITAAYRGLHFDADNDALYRINYQSRLLTRVLAPLRTFKCHTPEVLYKEAKELSWQQLFAADQTFAIAANVSNSKIKHSQYAALKLKDAIADHFMEEVGRRPSVERRNPDVWINLHIHQNQTTISLDTSGGSLHKRGYRVARVDAPMQETLAAAILELSEWHGERPLYDPMCGSGTLLAEAAMRYCKIPPGMLRKQFGFQLLPDYESQRFRQLQALSKAELQKLPPGLIAGSDSAVKAVASTSKNLDRLPLEGKIRIKRADFRTLPGFANTTIVCNPPYGLRLGNKSKLPAFYKDLGDFLKQRCTGSTAYIYFGEREFIRYLGLRPSWKKPLLNANLDGRLLKVELF